MKNPTSTDKNQTSRVYYCKYVSGRDVQKHGEPTTLLDDTEGLLGVLGWKRLDVQEFWFKGYNPSQG